MAAVRKMMGATNPHNADPGTIRGDLGLNFTMNLVHGSDSPESAERELKLFFGDGGLISYDLCDKAWLE